MNKSNKTKHMLTSLIMVSAFFFCCKPHHKNLDHSEYVLSTRTEWPEIVIPDDNPMTIASVEFGKQLFFDKRLSEDASVSCASCHKPEFGFADSKPLSLGVHNRTGLRNSGSLTNVAFLPYFNRDGGVKTLDRFSLVPIEDHDEMNLNLLVMKERLLKDKSYVYQAKEIYNREPDAFSVSRAIASYLRTFISDQSPYDRYVFDKDSTALNERQKRGYKLFFGDKAKCSSCHNGEQLTNYKFENNGLHQSYVEKDRGRQRVTDNPEDEGKFRVASIRNIALTAPYMHDGSLPDLKSVLDHYANHGQNNQYENPIIDSISLNEEDKTDIIAFLESLTDNGFINDVRFRK